MIEAIERWFFMTNQEIAKIFHEIAIYLEMVNGPFKMRAFEKAAEVINGSEEELINIYKAGGIEALKEIPGVGVSIAEKIEELIKTGNLKYYSELKKKIPIDLGSFYGIEGLGPKSLLKLYQKLGIKNINDLEKAAKSGKIRKLEGFGEKSEERILKGIEFAKRSSGRFILGFIMPEIREIEKKLNSLKEIQKVIIAGSVRRRKETIGDVDILAVAKNSKPVMDYFVSMPEAVHIYACGDTKSAVKLRNGLDVDLRVVDEKSYGAALNYFTGSKAHNVALREIALKKGLKLNEYGLFDGKKQIAGKSEEELYRALGMEYIEPEMRENFGEIELAKSKKLPKLIGYSDLKGDLQIQTNWSDGLNSIEEMAKSAQKNGLEYIAITDHTKRLAMANGLDEKRIIEQGKEINKINKKFESQKKKFRILKGTECDVLKDGALDLPDNILSKLDIVGVAVHSHFSLSRDEQTKRIIRAMKNSNVDILFHPTGRIIQKREAYDCDINEIIKIAKKTKTILEIDAFPNRLDLKDEYVKKCMESGVKISIDSDAHSLSHISYLEYGIAQARRGWATKNDVINTWPLGKMLDFLKK
ncbi:MAG: DNA polymerase/3'-5' exonuclease PolX [Patescibacteria group bacterium]|nr:DNA polymerase/3'-5' exonuclease PolX [Patescibacteria group bacterium]